MKPDSPARSGGLVLDHLYVAQGNSTLLDALDVTVQPGQCLAVQCNHVTGQLIMNVLAGTAATSTGTVSWNGLPLHSPEARARISWIRQEDTVHERLTVREAVGLYMKLYNAFEKFRLESVLKLTGLWNKQNVRLDKCTEAEQRRFQLARAAAVKPELIIVEDPEFHLDLESCFLLRQWIRELCQEGGRLLHDRAFARERADADGHRPALDAGRLQGGHPRRRRLQPSGGRNGRLAPGGGGRPLLPRSRAKHGQEASGRPPQLPKRTALPADRLHRQMLRTGPERRLAASGTIRRLSSTKCRHAWRTKLCSSIRWR
ncbi:ATP-binding cassette domain-containing protein [Paenibacillus thiaminolyticus]|nr:ATP-binding cassette domain-containing protein [Paenibacillus thiaminolyticus]